MPSLLKLDSPPQIPAAGAGAWGSLYVVQEEPLKPPPRHVMVVVPAAKKPAYGYYGGRKKKNLDTCTEPLGCETGAVDVEAEAAAECAAAERKRRAREEEEEEEKEMEAQGRAARRPLPPPLTTLAARGCGGGGRVRMVHERRDGRLAMYAARAPGVEAERSGGRLRMRLVCSSLPSGSSVDCRRQEAEPEAEYVRGGRCVEPEGAAGEARQAVGAGVGCHVLGRRHLLNTTNGLVVAPTAY